MLSKADSSVLRAEFRSTKLPRPGKRRQKNFPSALTGKKSKFLAAKALGTRQPAKLYYIPVAPIGANFLVSSVARTERVRPTAACHYLTQTADEKRHRHKKKSSSQRPATNLYQKHLLQREVKVKTALGALDLRWLL
jgi:hypothetical protein